MPLSVVRNSILNLVSAIISMASGFIAAVVVARLLGAEGAGVTAFGFWVASCAAVICDRGYPQGILRFAARSDTQSAQRAFIRYSFTRFIPILVIAFAAACILSFAGKAWTDQADLYVWLAIAVLFLVYGLSNFSLSAARGSGDFYRPARNTILGSILFVPLSVIGALTIGPAGAILALASRYMPQALQLSALIAGNREEHDGSAIVPDKEFRDYRRQMWINDVIGIIALSRLEYLFLLILATKTDMGYFAVAIAFAGLVDQLAMQLSSPLVVTFSLDQRRRSNGAWLGVAFLFVPIAMGGSAIAHLLVPLVYGPEFADTGSAAAVMLLAGGMSALQIVPWTYLAAKGHAMALTRVMIISAIVTSIAAPIAILMDGVYALAWSRLLVESVILGILIFYARKKENMRPPVCLLAKMVVSGVASAIAAFAITLWIPTVTGISLAIICGAVSFLLTVKLTGAVPRDELSQLFQLMDGRDQNRLAHCLKSSLLCISRA
ncbi:lipopolysaccharide biosynthesis protein [Peteryoungia desertarenae]|uniref:Lipopolysaccharide biosynthesis protein n=1 Tax=Peteryoungia desertarenae TaxID=1813451 RepID=A0ABX6QJ76_9HYPH|nr:lipopolysaccharide biosynthesis protein [Peteryoungia desertarenae]QLF68529.1 lipopolysaccharide biosynthesis protein [Peteryoungia desertarenae]